MSSTSQRRDALSSIVTNFYTQHNRSKLPSVDEIVAEAVDLELTDDYVLDALYTNYSVPRPRASAAAPRQIVSPHRHGAAAGVNADVEFGQGKTLKHGQGGMKARARTEDVLQQQVREWVLEVLADAPAETPQLEQLRTEPNPVDALRDGVLLRWLIAKLERPDMATFPRARTGGYFNHDNVSQFVEGVKRICGLPQHQMFAGVDLVDGKNDRSVVTCLLAVGRWALDAGRLAPKVATLDREIEQQQNGITEMDIDRAIDAAEDDAASCGDIGSGDDDSDDDDAIAEAAMDAETKLVLEQPPHRRDEPAPAPAMPTPSAVREPVASAPPTPAAGDKATKDAASPKRYQARRNDAVDQRVGKAYNKLLARMQRSGKRLYGRIARTGRHGEYVIYHQITGRRTVVYVRELSSALMIRVGGGWEDFESYLARRLVDYEVVKPGTTQDRDRAARRRANTVRS